VITAHAAHGVICRFVGTIDINDAGKKFSGTINDIYGDAIINGEFKENEIVFVKEYTHEAKTKGTAASGPVKYSFSPFIVNDVVMGWRGTWRKKKEPRAGRASCLIFPDFHGPQ
ncbi:MAG: hypothetical protein Q8N81_02410, partial [bacterium]|nr:hypothetical protein [bacterium]